MVWTFPKRVVLLATVLRITVSFAQGPLLVQGSVVDATGAAIPSAVVRLQAASADRQREVHVDSNGSFTLTGLAAGDYILTVPAVPGFAVATRPLHLLASIAGLKVTLPLAPIEQTVAVGNDDAVSTDPAANKDTIQVSAQDLRKLPVFDQNFLGALTGFLDPGSAGSGGVAIVVDGIERKNAGVSASAIKEVRVNNDPYSAEFRSAGRGRIEIITKPGSPEYHGEANFLFRDATLNATNFFAPAKPAEQRRIYEGNMTGPVGRGGHTTFLVSGSRRDEDVTATVHAVGPAGFLDANVQTPNRTTQLQGRLSHDRSPAHRVSLQYNFEYDTSVNQNVGGLTLAEAGSNNDSREDDLSFTDRYIFSPRLINQFQVILEKDEDVTRSVTHGLALRVGGAFNSGGAQADISRSENTVHINDVVSLTQGRHYMRFGPNLPQISRRAVDDATNRLGIYSFASLQTYLADAPDQFTIQQGPGRGLYWINEMGGFFTDQIALTPKLQVSAGVRFDWQTYLTDNDNFSPRLSAAYAPGKGKTIFRTGAGIFYDRTGGDFPATVKLHNGIVLQAARILKPPFPPAGAVAFPGGPSDRVLFAQGISTPYTFQYNLGMERALTTKLTLAGGYRGYLQVKTFRSRDANAPLLGAVPDKNGIFPRPYAGWGRVQQIESGGRQLFSAFDLSLRGAAGRWFTGQAQYMLSKLRNDAGGLNWFPQDQYRPNAEWARADGDRRHRFTLLGNINPDHWLTLGVAAGLYSAPPYTELLGFDLYNTGLGNARPLGVPRNSLHATGIVNLDLSWNHDFHLDHSKGDDGKLLTVQISGFNVLNHANLSGYVGTLGSPLFRQATVAAAPRQLQFQFGYRF